MACVRFALRDIIPDVDVALPGEGVDRSQIDRAAQHARATFITCRPMPPSLRGKIEYIMKVLPKGQYLIWGHLDLKKDKETRNKYSHSEWCHAGLVVKKSKVKGR